MVQAAADDILAKNPIAQACDSHIGSHAPSGRLPAIQTVAFKSAQLRFHSGEYISESSRCVIPKPRPHCLLLRGVAASARHRHIGTPSLPFPGVSAEEAHRAVHLELYDNFLLFPSQLARVRTQPKHFPNLIVRM